MRFLICILIASLFVKSGNAEFWEAEADEDKIAYEKYLAIDKNLKHFAGRAVGELLPLVKRANALLNISSRCDRDITQLILDLRKLKLSAFQFLDAMGKPAEGIMGGSFIMAGDYDQCLSSKILHENGDVAFKGQYCMLICKPPLPKRRYPLTIDGGFDEFVEQTKNLSEVIKFVVSILQFSYIFPTKYGLCVPSGCSVDDVQRLTNYVGEQIYATITVDYCDEGEDIRPTTMKTISICVFSILGALVIVGTAMDYFCTGSKPKGCDSLMCFSVIRNFPKILDTTVMDNSMSCLNGIRVLCFWHVILGHHYLVAFKTLFQDHIFNVVKWPHLLKHQIFSNGALVVDIFFFLGGLVNFYSICKKNGKEPESILKRVIHRLWRVYPTYVSAILLVYLFENSGPYSRFVYNEVWSKCSHNWWKNLIFINNYFDQPESCLFHEWYIAADMQLFLISQFTIPLLMKSAKKGLLLNLAVLCCGIIGTLILSWYTIPMPSFIAYRMELEDFMKLWNTYTNILPHTGAYFIGILLGYFMYSVNDLKLSKGVQIVGWLTASVMFVTTLFMTAVWNSGVQFTLMDSTLYFTFSKILIVFPVCWVVVCCSRGYGGVVNYVLSLKMWIPLARISFMTYMVSLVIQFNYVGNKKTATDMNDMISMWIFFGDIVVSCLFAVVMVLVVEFPFIEMEKVLNWKKSGKKEINNSEECKIASLGKKTK